MHMRGLALQVDLLYLRGTLTNTILIRRPCGMRVHVYAGSLPGLGRWISTMLSSKTKKKRS